MEQVLARAMEQEISKAAVQEKQLLLSRLLARLAHEIRNPLSSLDIHVQLLDEDLARAAPELRERASTRFEIIRSELQRLDALVKQFLSLAGPSSIQLQPVEIARLAGHVRALLRPEAEARHIALELRVAAALPVVTADPAQLTQALVNLVLNAVQAVGRDGRIEIAAGLTAGGDALLISVQDTGPGLPPGQEAAIFEPFFTTKPDGSGLGLWIVQQIVAAHGGSVSAVGPTGGGAVFTLHLPLHNHPPAHG